MTTYPLIDARVVAQTFALRREVCTPTLDFDQVVMPNAQVYGSVLRDRSGQWRMWYLSPPDYCEYYATSNDGIEWERPELDLVWPELRPELTGPNAIMSKQQQDANGRWLSHDKGPEGFCVLDAELTPHPAAERRFTVLYLARGTEVGSAGMHLASSDDGIHWLASEHNPVIPKWLDTDNNFFYDKRLGRYVLYGRPNAHVEHATRANRLIGRCESSDMVNWTPFQTVLDTDERDADAYDLVDEGALRAGTPLEDARERAEQWRTLTEGAVTDGSRPAIRGRSRQWYGLTVFPYADLYLGYGWMYDLPSGCMWVELVHSYDGIDWRREALRQPFIDGRAHGYGMVCPPGSPPVPVGDDLWIYFSGRRRTHHNASMADTEDGKSRMFRTSVRRGRWAAYRADSREAELLTQMISRPEAVRLNASTADGGWIRAEVTDSLGDPLAGFTLEDCAPLSGDAFDLTPCWGEGKSLDQLGEDNVRLRLVCRHASLYAIEC